MPRTPKRTASDKAPENLLDSLTDGAVANSVKSGSQKIASDFQEVADARTVPEQPAATGQPLTHYHSMIYRLLSWKNPRATAISYASTVAFIFASRYLNVLPYMLKLGYWALGTTALLELAGKMTVGHGIASQFRPKRYFVIPKDSMARFLDDAAELTNFFVIEFQRVLFAENVNATIAAFFASLTAYWLIKWVPLWGLALTATSLVYMLPLVYTRNKEVIDANLDRGAQIIARQADQVRSVAAQHTGQVSETARNYLGEYGKKAQKMMGQRGGMEKPDQMADAPAAPKDAPGAKSSGIDLPSVPAKDPLDVHEPGEEDDLLA